LRLFDDESKLIVVSLDTNVSEADLSTALEDSVHRP